MTMNLYSIYTDEEAALKDIFVKSIKDPWGIHVSYWGRLGGDAQGWGTAEFVALMRRRIEFLIGTIKKEIGNIIIWSDIDIQFFRACTQAIEKAIDGKDMVFLAERWPLRKINAGFIVIRCSARTQAFFEAVLRMDFETMKYHDQSAINKLLKSGAPRVSWNILPRKFWAKSHAWMPPRDIAMHHANMTFPRIRNGKKIGCVELKLEQLSQVRDFVAEYPRRKWRAWRKWYFELRALMF